MVDTEGEILKFRPGGRWRKYFSWNSRVSWEVLRKSSLERYKQLSFIQVCKYINQKIRIIGE